MSADLASNALLFMHQLSGMLATDGPMQNLIAFGWSALGLVYLSRLLFRIDYIQRRLYHLSSEEVVSSDVEEDHSSGEEDSL